MKDCISHYVCNKLHSDARSTRPMSVVSKTNGTSQSSASSNHNHTLVCNEHNTLVLFPGHNIIQILLHKPMTLKHLVAGEENSDASTAGGKLQLVSRKALMAKTGSGGAADAKRLDVRRREGRLSEFSHWRCRAVILNYLHSDTVCVQNAELLVRCQREDARCEHLIRWA